MTDYKSKIILQLFVATFSQSSARSSQNKPLLIAQNYDVNKVRKIFYHSSDLETNSPRLS